MNTLSLSVFIITGFLCILTYVLYPAVIWVIGRAAPFIIKRSEIQPPVSIIIAAYNEEKHIEQKIINTMALDYPNDKVEILIGSDGSSDRTLDILDRYASRGIRTFNYRINRGKTSVQNDLVREANGEILILTDAASFLSPDAIRLIVRNFADEKVGCVAGRMVFTATDENITTQSQGMYWKYESGIRVLESKLGRVIGVDGPLYAMRRELYIPLEPDMISDFLSPLLVLQDGNRVVLEEQAVVREEPKKRTDQEFETRRRITLRALTALFRHPGLLNPISDTFLAFQIIAHKLLRWAVGILVAVNLICCSMLARKLFFKIILAGYIVFFISALMGWCFSGKEKKIPLLSIPYYFILVNAAATMGLIDFLRSRKATTWQTLRD